MSRKIQISKDLFDAMANYIRDHFDPLCSEEFSRICSGIWLKESNLRRHNLFTAYKTEKEPDTMEMLRLAYLDESGIPSHGRWDAETNVAIRKMQLD